MAPRTIDLEYDDSPLRDSGRPLPGITPGEIPGREHEIAEAMWNDVAVHQAYEIWTHDNRSSRTRDPDDGSLMLLQQPYSITTTKYLLQYRILDDGISITFDDGDSHLEHLSLLSSHQFCRSCKQLLDHYCMYFGGLAKEEPKPDDPLPKRFVGQNCVILHSNLVSLLLGDIKGCHLCTLIFQRMHLTDPQATRPAPNMEKYRIEACWSAKRRDKHSDSHRIFFALVDPSLPKGRWNWNEVYRLQMWPFESSSRFFGAGTREYTDAVAPTKTKVEREAMVVQGKKSSARKLFGELSIGKGRDKQAPEQEAQSSEIVAPSVAEYEDRGKTSQSKQSVALAQSWLEKCVSNRDGRHTECSRSAKASNLPRRVLDLHSVASTGRIKLVCPYDTSDLPKTQYEEHVNDKYITLSHKWGKMMLPVLLDSNIQNRIDEGLEFTTLPETFKQAVVIASWFNVRWLYIDCLCIIQDSRADWVREAASMARYYSGALLCISATYADDARMGCWVRRDPKSLSTPLIHAKNTDQSWFVAVDHHYQFSWMLNMPLFDRAWCHRERQLSPRILHFTDSEIVWECCGTDGSSFASETFPGGAPFKRLMSADTRKFQSSKLRDEGRSEILAVWNDLCEGFSQKSLTKAADMPIILSSLAEEFLLLLRRAAGDGGVADSTKSNDEAATEEYIAGLWKSTLPQSLLWKVTEILDETPTFDYVAPSRSWMSLRSPLELYGNRISGSTKHQLAILESVTTQPQYANQPFGPLASAELELTCIVRKIRFTEVENEQLCLSVYEKGTQHEEWREIGIGHDDYEGDLFELFLDREWDLEAENVEHHVCFIELDPWWQKGGMANNRDLLCLLLEEVESQKGGDLRTFRRAGLLKLHDLYALKMRYHMWSADEQALSEALSTPENTKSALEKLANAVKNKVDEIYESRGAEWRNEEKRGPDPMLLYEYDGILKDLTEGDVALLVRLEEERIVLV